MDFAEIFFKMSSPLPNFNFFEVFTLFRPVFVVSYLQIQYRKNSLNYSFTKPYPCNIQSQNNRLVTETWSLRDRDETWNLRDSQNWTWRRFLRPRPSLETPSLLNSYDIFLHWQHSWHPCRQLAAYALSCLCISVSNAVVESSPLPGFRCRGTKTTRGAHF